MSTDPSVIRVKHLHIGVVKAPVCNSQGRKFRRSEDRSGDMHEGPGREYPDIERELHADFHDLRFGEAITESPLDYATHREVVLVLDHPGRQGADEPALHVETG